MISFCCPSRGRPKLARRLIDTAQETAKDKFEIMLYLNDVEEGGVTNFPLQKKSVKPKCGTLVIWPAGFPYLHNGEMPISNNKYIITTWLEYVYEK